jgi:hypothetical protein
VDRISESNADAKFVRDDSSAPLSHARLDTTKVHRTRSHTPPKRVELPFTVRIVRTQEQLDQAVTIRAEAYRRHVPTLADAMNSPEDLDRSSDTIIFLAEGKSDRKPLGTIRIQTNFRTPLSIEASITLPRKFNGRPSAGVSRLAVKAGPRGRLVKLALFKALHRYCLAKQVEWILIGARSPLDKTYLDLGFVDVFEDQAARPLASASGLPHRILCFEVFTAERRWHELSHPLYLFMGERFHPDIEIFSSVSNMWSTPRKIGYFRNPPDFSVQLPVV